MSADDFFGAALVFNALGLAAAVCLLFVRYRLANHSLWRDWFVVPVVGMSAGAGTAAYRGIDPALVVLAATSSLAAIAVCWRWRWLHLPGVALLVTSHSTAVTGMAWCGYYALTIDVVSTTRFLLLACLLLTFATVPVGLLSSYLASQVFYRDTWSRPNRAHAPVSVDGPKVSIHVPCYAEPPHIVIETLDALAQLQYNNFEVIVVDNNTVDPDLWQPVEEHCRLLGDRFRFFHVAPLSGAKGGALNYALAKTAPDAELIALVDADYRMQPDFLARLVGHFEDRRLGFVQCRYDFRDWQGSLFQTGCYWNYRWAFPTLYRSVNELTAAFPMGTACLLRKKALMDVGGWAEWCLTEDSELGVRLHAAGYTSYNFDETYGHGLVPETFAAFARQRFRWTYGPVQQLKRHWRLFLPKPFGRPSHLTRSQKLLHLLHGTGLLSGALRILLVTPLGYGVLISMVVHDERPPVPHAMWLAMGIGMATSSALRWTQYTHVLGATPRGTLASKIVGSGLSFTHTAASLAGLFTRTTSWRRTSKFKHAASGWHVIRSVKAEVLLGTALLASATAAFLIDHSGLFLVLEVAAAWRSTAYFAAAAAALLADHDLRAADRAPVDRTATTERHLVHEPTPELVG